MKLPAGQTAGSLAGLIGAEVLGDANVAVTGINEIHMVEPGDIVFTDHPKYYKSSLESVASCILINERVDVPAGKAVLFSDDPFRDFNRLILAFWKLETANQNVHPTATIGEGTVIYPGAVVGANAVVGSNCIIHPNVSIYQDTVIGNNVIIHANTCIGSDAFYFKRRPEKHDKLNTCGNVHIQDDVEIGSACTIDRGVTGTTTIGKGTKIDNQVHIGHDTQIGERCLFAAQVGVAGCVVVEDEVTLWGQVGIAANITIEKGVTVYAQGGVGKSLKAGQTYAGSPADIARRKWRELAALRALPGVLENL